VRVTLRGRLSTARETLHVDVNVGDPIWPAPQPVHRPRLLGGAIEVLGYPIEMVLAQKIVTTIQRGIANTRWRDFADIYLLTGTRSFASSGVNDALARVSEHRGVTVVALREALAGHPDLAQPKWRAWRSRQHLDDRLPEQFDDVLAAVFRFSDPLSLETATRSAPVWSPALRAWQG
jgi:Nucleotidyl transferase AbiEii toxin, Type IV TA system